MNPASSPSQPPEPTQTPDARLDRVVAGLMVGCLVLGIAGALWLAQHPGNRRAAGQGQPLAAFTLVERTGRSISRADLTNQVLVVNCMFTSCSLSCRAVNSRMAEIQQLLLDRPGVLLVSLTIDPRTDTPATLSRFADELGARTNRWLFLTGDKPVLYGLIEQSFLRRTPDLEDVLPGGFENMDHIFLVDRQGVVRQTFDGLRAGVPQQIATRVAQLLQETPPP